MGGPEVEVKRTRTSVYHPEPRDYSKKESKKGKMPPIWWENAIFFVATHFLALYGIFYLSPWNTIDWRTALMCFTITQLGLFGMTMGCHRLWSHRAYVASFPLKIGLAVLCCLSFQGSVKWWALRHRLHHRWTDSDDDPYDATKGMVFAHCGWIFFKPKYEKMTLIDRKDLDTDKVVQFQHKFYVPLSLFWGFVFPTALGYSYGDTIGGLIWGGVVTRILIWHATFCLNSFAHMLGEQPFTDETTARGNLILAIVTAGEANHNYHHAFPRDYRNGIQWREWDPTKWAIWSLWKLGLVRSVYMTPESDILEAKIRMLKLQKEVAESEESNISLTALWSKFAVGREGHDSGADSSVAGSSLSGSQESSPKLLPTTSQDHDQGTLIPELGFSNLGGIGTGIQVLKHPDESATIKKKGYTSKRAFESRPSESFVPEDKKATIPVWTRKELQNAITYLTEQRKGSGARPLVVMIDGYAVDCSPYVNDHPGGVAVMRRFAIPTRATGEDPDGKAWPDATESFFGGLNQHFYTSIKRMETYRIAKIVD